MSMRAATSEEVARWDDLIAANPGGASMWQFGDFAALKAPEWSPERVVHDIPGGPVYVTYLRRRVPVFGVIWYAPAGPRVASTEQFEAVCDDLRRHSPAFVVVTEPPLPATSAGDAAALASQIPGLQRINDIQFDAHTVVVDLTRSEEELLASFKQRVRRYIRKNADATITHVTDSSGVDMMWSLYEQTARRAGAHIRTRDYFERFWRRYLADGQGHFVFGTPAGDPEPTAAAFILHAGAIAMYKDGGSTREKDTNGLQYRVQWEAMRWAKEHGATSYDMYGTPPSWQADDPQHHLHGLVQFKTGFAPIVDRVGAFAMCRNPRIYAAWERFGFPIHRRTLGRHEESFY